MSEQERLKPSSEAQRETLDAVAARTPAGPEAGLPIDLHGVKADLFWNKASPGGECLEWTAWVDEDGYGRFYVGKRRHRAHRVAWALSFGPIPDGMTIDHLCRNRRCVNPSHLEPVTNAVNVSRGRLGEANRSRALAQTHCKRGHPRFGEGAEIRMTNGRRECKPCQRERARERARAVEAINRGPAGNTGRHSKSVL